MKLSLCIATHNEEIFIHYPLDSAIELADEVVIVDGSSEDKTVEIAKSYGPKVRIISSENPSMFHINKQKALDAAKGEWILQLDADEALSEKLKEEISVILNEVKNPVNTQRDPSLPAPQDDNDGQPVAYWIPRKNWFLNRFLTKGGIYPDATIRLYKNGKGKFPCKSVHENVEIHGEIGHLTSDILHYADPNFERYLARWNRYTSLDVKMILEKKEKLNFFNYFIIKPKLTFLSIYVRHKGFQDGFPGFVWALFSSIRYWVIYIKWWASSSNTK